MKSILSTTLAVVLTCLTLPASGEASLTNEGLKTYVKKVGARIEEAKGNLLVTSMAVAGKGRVQIRLMNDATKSRLGFYAYGFGNARSAKDVNDLYAYLLRANSDLAIGSFFVDEDQDVGYKFFLSTRDTVSYATFETAYVAMANVIAERGPRIMRLASGGAAPGTETPAGTSTDTPTEKAAADAAEPPTGEPSTESPPADAPPTDAPPTDEPPAAEPVENAGPDVTNETVFEVAPRPRRTKKP